MVYFQLNSIVAVFASLTYIMAEINRNLVSIRPSLVRFGDGSYPKPVLHRSYLGMVLLLLYLR